MRKRAWIGIVVVAAAAGLAIGRKSQDASTSSTRFAVPLTTPDPKVHVEVDLYVPPRNPTRTLLVFLQGNDPDEPDERSAYAAEVGQTFQRRDVEVAAVTFQFSAQAPLRACAENAAKAIAEVGGGFSRVVLAGRGIGAWAAAMLALDTHLFADAGFDASRIQGVIGMRGPYDMPEPELAPARFVRPDAPPFLLISAGSDDAKWPFIDRNFALALAKGGVKVERHIVPYRDQHSLTHWTGAENDLGELVAGFVEGGLKPLQPDAGVLEMQQRWDEHPPLDLADFRADASRIKTLPVDAALKKTLDVLFGIYPYVLHQMPGRTFESIDLASWLATRPESEVGKGDYLVVTNLRGEQLYYTRAEIETLKPVVVVGLDDEKNLYRLFGYYRLRHAYSWKKGEEPMPLMIRPLGAFLHFPTAPPPELANKTYAPFSLTTKSFHWQEADPLAPVRDLSATLKPTMIGSEGCLKCHAFKSAGAKAHHLLSSTGASYGAFALALEEYPPDVLRRFLFDQASVAKGFDVAPLLLDKPIAEELFTLVARERK